MKFAKIALLGLALSLVGPAALASTIYGVLKTDGTGVNGGAAVNAGNLAFIVSPSPGKVIAGTNMAGAVIGSSVSYDPGDSNLNINFTKVSASKPALLLVVGSYKIYLTSVSNIVAGKNGNPGAVGSFTGGGYITKDNGATTTPITVSWLSDTKGNGKVNFVATITAATAPEPASIMLMGTGLLGTAGAMLRRRRTA